MTAAASEKRAHTSLVLGGKTGLLGQAVTQVLQAAGRNVVPTGRRDFIHTEIAELEYCLDTIKPDCIYNCVGYTQVDAAEDNEHEVMLINRGIPTALGRLLQKRSIQLIHFSSDFVFDGTKTSPYTEEDVPNPISVYGRSKLLGEQALLEMELEHCCIVRTSRLFGPGKHNFVTSILNACALQDTLAVVHDQTGSPSYTLDIAQSCLILADKNATGVFHVSNFGSASWCEFASEAIQLANKECRIDPIPTAGYPQKARRPVYSVLDTKRFTQFTGITPRPWPQALREYVYQNLLIE